MRALSIVDHVFLLLDAKQPMNVAGISVFEVPADDDGTFVNIIHQTMLEHRTPEFPFNQALYRGVFWQADPNFDIHQHVFYHDLEHKPLDDFLAYIASKHSERLDKHRPLWQCHLVDNIAPMTQDSPKRFAVYFKLSHVLADGVAAMRLWQSCLTTTPDTPFVPFWAIKKDKKKPTSAKKIGFGGQLKTQAQSLIPVGKALAQRFAERHLPDFVSNFDAPSSIFNQKISAKRQLAAQTLDKARIEKIAKAISTDALPITNNDVILAVCAGALRQYLAEQNALPPKPLIGFVPVSLRKDDSVSGNQLSFLLNNLATDLAEPKEQLFTIARSMQDGKRRFANLTPTQIINYSLAIYGLCAVNLTTGLMPSKQAFNLIISNIPADNERLYLGGAKLSAMYPASVLLDGQALNITFANYANRIDIGIIACKYSLAGVEKLADYLEQALVELENCCQF